MFETFQVLNYPSGNVQTYPGLSQNAMPLQPVYYPSGGANYPTGNYPQYPTGAPFPNAGYPNGFVNSIRTRIKRQTMSSKNKLKSSDKSNKKTKNKIPNDDSEPKDHWGVHRILSTGMSKYFLIPLFGRFITPPSQ